MGAPHFNGKTDDWVAWEYDSTTGEGSQYDYKDKLLPNVPEHT
ncbi:hypothetical protein DSCO28_59880 [Desulfosarcina ovata subsp. sediminis]|uniref:Uncharacterized protein n=1 Tax=Desulfosarcina ovata subsp. sediminis TaxID=885957 RepID=A0A5K7ZYT1_9BACT|nr:hypothetical protein DSCO28_59880 [Desulfosarcina ovata subsp. sediminis]